MIMLTACVRKTGCLWSCTDLRATYSTLCAKLPACAITPTAATQLRAELSAGRTAPVTVIQSTGGAILGTATLGSGQQVLIAGSQKRSTPLKWRGRFDATAATLFLFWLTVDKQSKTGGGALYIRSGSTVSVIGCVFSGNAASGGYGGAMAVFAGSNKINIVATTFTGNTATIGATPRRPRAPASRLEGSASFYQRKPWKPDSRDFRFMGAITTEIPNTIGWRRWRRAGP